jgi:type IV secretion system protein VirB6
VKKFICIILILISFSSVANVYALSKKCIATNDIGQGGVFDIPANPSPLVIDNNPDRQIAPWTYTGLSTYGATNTVKNKQLATLKVYVTGRWSTYGGDVSTIPECPLVTCNPAISAQTPCMTGGMSYVPDIDTNVPCYFQKGWGLYGLVALDINGTRYDPNSVVYAETLPEQFFRTFRVSPLKTDGDGDYFELDFTNFCYLNDSGDTVCNQDVGSDGKAYIPKGSLFFKIYDNYYYDNVGAYEISIVSGVDKGPGFIDQIITEFKNVLNEIKEAIFTSVVNNTMFRGIVVSALILYVAFTGVLFAMGGIQATQTELVVRLVKLAIVATLISPDGWEFFNTYLFSFFTTGSESISQIMLAATLKNASELGIFYIQFPDGANVLTIFDTFVSTLFALILHQKIASLWGYEWYFVYWIFIYVCLVIVMKAIFDCIMLYITALMVLAILLVTAPIFIITLLYAWTKELFEQWLKQLMVNSIMLIVVSIVAIIMSNLILDQLFKLLEFRACMGCLWGTPIYILGITVVPCLESWIPSDPAQLNKALTPLNFFSWMLVCFIFENFVKQIPSMIDFLAGAFLQPMSQFFGGAMQTFQASPVGRVIDAAQNLQRLATPGGLVNTVTNFGGEAAYRRTGQSNMIRDARGLQGIAGGLGQLVDKVDFTEKLKGEHDMASQVESKSYKTSEFANKVNRITGGFFDE